MNIWIHEKMEIPELTYEKLNWDTNFPVTPHVREFKKIGRNGLCTCGSGKKYKKCCLRKERK
jgi:uncharacterized protein YchJ